MATSSERYYEKINDLLAWRAATNTTRSFTRRIGIGSGDCDSVEMEAL